MAAINATANSQITKAKEVAAGQAPPTAPTPTTAPPSLATPEFPSRDQDTTSISAAAIAAAQRGGASSRPIPDP